MIKALNAILLLLLAGCSAIAQPPADPSPCSAGEHSYACQVERYHNVNAQ